MKKLILTLLFLFGAYFTLLAQNSVKRDIFSFLRTEGYAPSLDEDGDIKFKVQGTVYFALVKEFTDKNYAYVEVMAGYTTDTPLEKLIEISNLFNRTKYVCKCTAYESDGDNLFQVAMEFMTNSCANTEFQMAQALLLLPDWVEEFEDSISK